MRVMRKRASVVWAVLMAATCVSTWMLSRDAFTPVIATDAVFVIATVKVRYVILDFMELRHAPLVVRVAFEAWPLLVTSLVLAYYLAT
jgi:hypothetical protein